MFCCQDTLYCFYFSVPIITLCTGQLYIIFQNAVNICVSQHCLPCSHDWSIAISNFIFMFYECSWCCTLLSCLRLLLCSIGVVSCKVIENDSFQTGSDHIWKDIPPTVSPIGLSMWRVSRGGLVSGKPAVLRQMWRGLPSSLVSLQAVLERQSDHGIVFISG